MSKARVVQLSRSRDGASLLVGAAALAGSLALFLFYDVQSSRRGGDMLVFSQPQAVAALKVE